jgi:hypothetical protein
LRSESLALLYGSIQVYDPTGSKLLRKITDGVTDPEEIAIGSQ